MAIKTELSIGYAQQPQLFSNLIEFPYLLDNQNLTFEKRLIEFNHSFYCNSHDFEIVFLAA